MLRKQIEASREAEDMKSGFAAETPESPATARRRRMADLASALTATQSTGTAPASRGRTTGTPVRLARSVVPEAEDEDAEIEAGFAAARKED
jgi:hypothetical protein